MGPIDPMMTQTIVTLGQGAAAIGDYQAGKAEQEQLIAAANAEYAQGTRKAREEARRSKQIASNARAAMAASGGVSTDPQATRQLAEIEQTGEFNALSALFDAESRAQGLRYKAKLKGQETTQGAIENLSTVMQSASKTYQTYQKKKQAQPGKTFEENWWD
jgi:hypothetical protein